MIKALVSFYLAVILGFLLGRTKARALTKPSMYTLIYVLLPLIVFKSLLDEAGMFKEEFLRLVGLYLLGTGVSFLISLLMFVRLDRLKRCTAVLGSTLWNAFFIPIALVISFGLPEEAVLGVVVFTMCYHLFQPFFTLALALRIHGTYVRDVIIKGATFPPLWAAIFGLALGLAGFNFEFPHFHEFKVFTSYFSLIYVGLVLSRAPIPNRYEVSIIARVASIRLLITPLLLFPLISSLHRPMNVVAAWEVGSPTSISAVLYAALFGFDDELMAKIVVYVTFVGVLALPVRLIVLGRFLLVEL